MRFVEEDPDHPQLPAKTGHRQDQVAGVIKDDPDHPQLPAMTGHRQDQVARVIVDSRRAMIPHTIALRSTSELQMYKSYTVSR